jgi:hypothetical protein
MRDTIRDHAGARAFSGRVVQQHASIIQATVLADVSPSLIIDLLATMQRPG